MAAQTAVAVGSLRVGARTPSQVYDVVCMWNATWSLLFKDECFAYPFRPQSLRLRGSRASWVSLCGTRTSVPRTLNAETQAFRTSSLLLGARQARGWIT